jgi:hypothetical protein
VHTFPLSRILVVTSLLATAPHVAAAFQPAAIEGGQHWVTDSAARAGDARLAPYLGRTALQLRNNTVAWRSDLRFHSGTIEFDLAPMPNGNFIGIVFRRQGVYQEENIYLRPLKSGQFDAMQYAPHVNIHSTFQLYPQFHAKVALPREQWTHGRIEVTGERMRVFWGGSVQPVLVVPRLRGELGVGRVGFWARVNEKPLEWAAAVSNITINVTDSTGARGSDAPRIAAPPGTITRWEVSDPVKRDTTANAAVPASARWTPIATEEDGLVNLTRSLGTRRGGWTAFLRTTLTARSAGSVKLDIAYSDDAVVFLNGEQLYGGVNGFDSRYPGYLGHVKLGGEWVNLRLRPGRNELVVRVSDDNRFGWGLIARTTDPAGVLTPN